MHCYQRLPAIYRKSEMGLVVNKSYKPLLEFQNQVFFLSLRFIQVVQAVYWSLLISKDGSAIVFGQAAELFQVCVHCIE